MKLFRKRAGDKKSTSESHLLRMGHMGIPVVVVDLIAFLESTLDTDTEHDTRNLFRESGSANVVEDILDAYDTNRPVDLWRIADVHASAAALKTFYKKRLPMPQLDVTFANDFLPPPHDSLSVEERIEVQSSVIRRLPACKVLELKLLFHWLHRVAQQSAKTNMNERDLAIVFGPALFQSAFIVESVGVVVQLVRYFPQLFGESEIGRESAIGRVVAEPSSCRDVQATINALRERRERIDQQIGAVERSLLAASCNDDAFLAASSLLAKLDVLLQTPAD